MKIEKLTGQFAKFVLDSLSAHVAILDQNGVILVTNKAWKTFAAGNEIQTRPDTIGVNYLDICNAAMEASAEEAGGVYKGITDLIAGRIDEFVIDYPCHSPDEKRWQCPESEYCPVSGLWIQAFTTLYVQIPDTTPYLHGEADHRHNLSFSPAGSCEVRPRKSGDPYPAVSDMLAGSINDSELLHELCEKSPCLIFALAPCPSPFLIFHFSTAPTF